MSTPQAPIDLSYLQARRVLTRQCDDLHIIQVGCGGIGSQLAPSTVRIARECASRFQTVRITFYDGDVVEQKNIRRQQFCHAEIGHNKAETLAYRLGVAWGIDIEAVPAHFTARSLSAYRGDTLTVLLGCVDNAMARTALHNTLLHHQHNEGLPLWWIDGGCLHSQGQVLIGNAMASSLVSTEVSLPNLCCALPSPAVVHPELLRPRPDERRRQQPSCAEQAAIDPQSLTINMLIAAHMADYLLRLLITQTLTRFATYIDLDSGSTRSLYITPETLTRVTHVSS